MNDMTRTFGQTHAAAQTVLFIDHGTVVLYLDRICGTVFGTNPAADTADTAFLTGGSALIVIGAFDDNVIGTFMYVDDVLRTDSYTGSAGNTLLLVYLCCSAFSNADSSKLALIHTGSAADATEAAGVTLIVTAAAAGDQSRFIWKFFLNRFFRSHLSVSFHTGCP